MNVIHADPPKAFDVLKAPGQDGRPGYRFRWKSPDFADTLKSLKDAVPWQDREWHEDTSQWWVADGHDLTPIFPNWHGQMEAIALQGVLL